MSDADFASTFGRAPECSADAPGRVNLMGEHTDYNGGSVLPVAIPQRTRVWVAARGDDLVHAVSATLGGSMASYRLGQEAARGGWIDYVQGITQAAAARGCLLSGFDVWIDSSVPVGSGLSSSAALEVALLRALRALFRLDLDDVDLARTAQRAETELVGAQVGIMDQMAASLADERNALLLETLRLTYRRVPLPSTLELVVIDSGVRHANAGGTYNQRRRECEEAAAQLGVPYLGQLGIADLPAAQRLPEPLSRRASHVIRENARVPLAADALASADEQALRQLFAESHRSQRDDFEVSVPSIERLIAAAAMTSEAVAARLTGGGFGGSIVAFAEAGAGRSAAQSIVDQAGVPTARVVLPA